MNASISKKFIVAAPMFFLLALVVHADTRLMLYFTHLPQSEISAIKAELNKALRAPRHARDERDVEAPQGERDLVAIMEQNGTPGSLAQNQVDQAFKQYLTPKLSGFPLLYAGYITVTGDDGLAIFPLRHAQQKLYIAVTPDIKMIHVKGSSFSHAEYSPDRNTPLALYKCERLEDEKKDSYWKVTKIEKPDSMRINPITVVILTHPDNIFIEPKDLKSPAGEQIVVPPIRVIGNQDKELVSLRLIDLGRYFEKVRIEQKRANDTTVQKITTTF